jgi:hypothetical protein
MNSISKLIAFNVARCQMWSQIFLNVGHRTNTIYHAYLAWGQFYTNNSWIVVSIIVVVGWIVLFNVGAYFCLAKLRHIPKWNPFLEVLKQSILPPSFPTHPKP